jgi:hypothetical protein
MTVCSGTKKRKKLEDNQLLSIQENAITTMSEIMEIE